MVIGGEVSIGTRAKTAAIVIAGATETSEGAASVSAADDVPIVNLADGDS
jgi:hypothetical protein